MRLHSEEIEVTRGGRERVDRAGINFVQGPDNIDGLIHRRSWRELDTE